jgi:amino acid transporter
MVVAAVAPLGAACAVIPLVFALGGNASAPLYFLGAVVVLYLFAVGFTLMSRHVRNAGAFYSYVQAGLGKVPGAGTASLALASYVVPWSRSTHCSAYRRPRRWRRTWRWT